MSRRHYGVYGRAGRRSAMRRMIALALVAALIAVIAPASVFAAPPQGGTHKILVQNTDPATLAELARGGGTKLIDYGSFSLWRVPDAQGGALASRASVTAANDFDTIHLRGVDIDTTRPVIAPAANLRQTRVSSKQFWLVQFVGPIQPAWLDQLRADGAEIVQYLPNNAYVIWVDSAALTRIERSVSSDPVRQWTGEYHPAYRLAPALQNLSGAQMAPVTVQFYKTPNTDASVASLRARGGRVLMEREDVLHFVNISLELPAGALATVAAQPDVFNVEVFAAPVVKDEGQGQIEAGNIITTGGSVTPTGPGYLNWLASKGFPTNPAQYPVVVVRDSGFDTGDTNPAHPDFYVLGDKNQATRVQFLLNCTTDAKPNDTDGHGTHVAGSLGGYGQLVDHAAIDWH